MRKSRFSAEQITMALRQAEGGTPVDEICRKLGVSQATFFRWKKRFGSRLHRVRRWVRADVSADGAAGLAELAQHVEAQMLQIIGL
jgi:transposase-like protein